MGAMDNIREQLFRIFLLFFMALVVALLTLQIIVYMMTAKTIQEQMGNKCLGIAISVATLIENDTDSLKKYIETLDTSSEYYTQIKIDMEKIRFGNIDNIAFLYAEKKISESEVLYLFDGEISGTDTYSKPGSIERMNATRALCYETGRAYIGDFVPTVWGPLLSAYAPVRDKDTGELLALVGADVSIKQYNDVMHKQLFVILLNTLVFVILIVVLLFISSNTVEKRLFKDSLTGMFNRGFFVRFLKAHIKALKRKEYPVIIFIADIDHFKNVNDTYGHLFGDKVLSHVSGIMNEFMRKTDCLARYGGEEFAAIMPGLKMENAIDVVRRIHNAVGSAVTADESGDIKLNVTISIGVAQLNKNESIDNAISNADTALYEAKKTRNTVVLHTPGMTESSFATLAQYGLEHNAS
jgi:diguanylate cyclase (GGDEF)-like protein